MKSGNLSEQNCFNLYASTSSNNAKEIKILNHRPYLLCANFFSDFLHSFRSPISSLLFPNCITAFSPCSFVTRYTFSPVFYMAFDFLFVADSFDSVQGFLFSFRSIRFWVGVLMRFWAWNGLWVLPGVDFFFAGDCRLTKSGHFRRDEG